MPLARDLILDHLRTHPHSICVTCLSKAVALPFDRALDAWADLKLRGDYPIRRGVCSVCETPSTQVIEPRG